MDYEKTFRRELRRMAENKDATSNDVATPEARRRLVNIQMVFSADTDDEALAVKKAVSAALEPWPKIALQFQIQEAPPKFQPPQV